MLWAVVQTAHEPSYLVKHLLGSLPPVVDRVKLMRKGQAPNGSQEDNFAKMAQSQVCLAPLAVMHRSTCHTSIFSITGCPAHQHGCLLACQMTYAAQLQLVLDIPASTALCLTNVPCCCVCVVSLQSLQLAVQEAYIRGVSGWNFDVAALKRSANEEGSGLERLSTIAETPGQSVKGSWPAMLYFAMLVYSVSSFLAERLEVLVRASLQSCKRLCLACVQPVKSVCWVLPVQACNVAAACATEVTQTLLSGNTCGVQRFSRHSPF